MFIMKDMHDGTMPGNPIYTGLDVCAPANAANCLEQ